MADKHYDETALPEIGNLLFGNSYGNHRLDRLMSQDKFCEFLDEIHCDGYGYYKGREFVANQRGGITNSTFEINPYYWGDDESEMDKPNFIYYPENIEIRWYKYPMRDAYSNVDLNESKFIEILDECRKAMGVSVPETVTYHGPCYIDKSQIEFYFRYGDGMPKEGTEVAYRPGIDKLTEYAWHDCSNNQNLPLTRGEYIVTIHTTFQDYVSIARFTKNLFLEAPDVFSESEYGDKAGWVTVTNGLKERVQELNGIIAWMPLIPPFEK